MLRQYLYGYIYGYMCLPTESTERWRLWWQADLSTPRRLFIRIKTVIWIISWELSAEALHVALLKASSVFAAEQVQCSVKPTSWLISGTINLRSSYAYQYNKSYENMSMTIPAREIAAAPRIYCNSLFDHSAEMRDSAKPVAI